MKKNFFKKMSVVLALALTVSAVAPAATTASAAAAPDFKSASVNVKVGQTKSYGMKNVTAWSVKKFVTGNKKVATVAKSGKTAKVTGVAEGKTTLRADLKAYKSKRDLQVRMPVTVVPDKAVLSNVTQVKTNEIVAKFSAALTEANMADFSLVREDSVVFPLKEVSLDSTDKTKVTVTTYSDMKDSKTYTLTFDGKSASFAATDGTVADVNVTPLTVMAGKEKEISVQTIDAKGVVLSTAKLESQASNIDFSVTTNDGYVSGSKLFLSEVGNTATAKATYHTYKYDSEGNETDAVTKEFTIVAVKDDTTISNFEYTVGSAPVWDAVSFTAKKQIQIDKPTDVYFRIKDSNGDEISNYGDYKVSSSDTSKMLVAEDTLTSSTTGVGIVGVTAGTAYIIVKDASSGATITTLPITIVAASKATSLTLGTTALSVSTGAALEKEISATVKDQYGDTMYVDYDSFTVELLSNPSKADDSVKSSAVSANVTNTSDRKITVKGSDFGITAGNDAYGTYVFKATAKIGDNSVSRTYSINVVKTSASDASSYTADLSGNSVDTTITKDTSGNKTVTLNAYEMKKGVAVSQTEATFTAITVKKADGTVIAATGAGITKVSCAAIDAAALESAYDDSTLNITVVKENSSDYAKNLAAGTYSITAVVRGRSITKTFTVVDNQPAASISISNTDCENGTVEALLTNPDKATITYEGIKQTIGGSLVIDEIKGTKLTNGGAFVTTVKMKVAIPGSTGPKTVTVTVTLNKAFTNVSDFSND